MIDPVVLFPLSGIYGVGLCCAVCSQCALILKRLILSYHRRGQIWPKELSFWKFKCSTFSVVLCDSLELRHTFFPPPRILLWFLYLQGSFPHTFPFSNYLMLLFQMSAIYWWLPNLYIFICDLQFLTSKYLENNLTLFPVLDSVSSKMNSIFLQTLLLGPNPILTLS